jgi:mono/diheme cytochrome c family protein
MKKLCSEIIRYIGLPGAAIGAWLAIDCSAGTKSETVSTETAAPVASGKGGAELWADNCIRCHNVRSPTSFSAAQWDVAMLHMRIRANITPEEQKKILEFLKSGSGVAH